MVGCNPSKMPTLKVKLFKILRISMGHLESSPNCQYGNKDLMFTKRIGISSLASMSRPHKAVPVATGSSSFWTLSFESSLPGGCDKQLSKASQPVRAGSGNGSQFLVFSRFLYKS